MLFFDDKMIMNKVMEYSNNPRFKELLKERIKEVMGEAKAEKEVKVKTGGKELSKKDLKMLVKEIMDDIKEEGEIKKEQKRLGKKKVENVVEKELSGLFYQAVYVLGSEKLYIWVTGSLVLFIVLFLFTRLYLFLYLTLISVLTMIIIGARIRRLHRKIFEMRYD